MRNSRRGLLALAMLAAATAAHADWRRDYDRGIKAVEQQDWVEAEAAFRAALNEDPGANARKRFQGTRFDVYVPHYYAGLAAYRQGNCARAMEYWNNAASATVVSGIDPLASAQRSGIEDCRRKLATTPAAPVMTPTPAPSASTPATTVAAPATPPPRPAPPPRVVSAPPARQTPPPPPATTPARVAAPAALVTTVGQYLSGDYVALDRLDPATVSDDRARAQIFLLRAAARHARSLLANDAPLLDQARRDVRAARAADQALIPDETAFSPRFRAFWRDTR